MYSPYFPICALWSSEGWLAIAQSEDCMRVKHRWGHGGAYFTQHSFFCISPSPQPAWKLLDFFQRQASYFKLLSGVQVICLILHVWLSTCIFCSRSRGWVLIPGWCLVLTWGSSMSKQLSWARLRMAVWVPGEAQGYWHTQSGQTPLRDLRCLLSVWRVLAWFFCTCRLETGFAICLRHGETSRSRITQSKHFGRLFKFPLAQFKVEAKSHAVQHNTSSPCEGNLPACSQLPQGSPAMCWWCL